MPNLEDFPDFAAFNVALIDEFRNNAGKVTGMFAAAPLVLITTTGARSGQPRTAPLVHTRTASGDVVIIASKAGAPTHPDWYHNIANDPSVTVELPNETFSGRARICDEPERTELYEAQAALMPNFDEYRSATTRTIPVVVIERA